MLHITAWQLAARRLRGTAVLLLGAILMHPLYTVTDKDPKTCYTPFPDTKARKRCDRAFKDHVGSHFVTEEEKTVHEPVPERRRRSNRCA